MILPKDGKLLRIFVGENDKYEEQPLYEWIVQFESLNAAAQHRIN